MCRLPKLTSPFQVIITIAWLIGVTSNIPTFIHLKVTNGLCYETWPDDWKIRTYNIFLTTQVCVALSVMVTLYSRVVFALWFKRNGTNAVTPQQKVSADKLVCKKSDTGFLHCQLYVHINAFSPFVQAIWYILVICCS